MNKSYKIYSYGSSSASCSSDGSSELPSSDVTEVEVFDGLQLLQPEDVGTRDRTTRGPVRGNEGDLGQLVVGQPKGGNQTFVEIV